MSAKRVEVDEVLQERIEQNLKTWARVRELKAQRKAKRAEREQREKEDAPLTSKPFACLEG